jgi:hypothetical protein
MQITCSECKQTWEVPAGQLMAAKIKFGLGFQEHTFTCPNCGAKNLIPEDMFRAINSSRHQIPVTGPHPGVGSPSEQQTHAHRAGGKAPVNPVPGPESSIPERHGVVMTRSLDVRRDHSMRAEIMAGLRKGEKVKILDTWTEGDDIWAQLGPERWVAILYDGDGFIELLDE